MWHDWATKHSPTQEKVHAEFFRRLWARWKSIQKKFLSQGRGLSHSRWERLIPFDSNVRSQLLKLLMSFPHPPIVNSRRGNVLWRDMKEEPLENHGKEISIWNLFPRQKISWLWELVRKLNIFFLPKSNKTNCSLSELNFGQWTQVYNIECSFLCKNFVNDNV